MNPHCRLFLPVGCLVLAVGLLHLAAAESPPAAAPDPRMDPAATDRLRFQASAVGDWQLDALRNCLRLQALCDNNHRHGLQELAAYGKRNRTAGTAGFSPQSLLQGEGATIDLTQPYQLHVDAVSITPILQEEADFIRAHRFHLLQRFTPTDGANGAQIRLTLDAMQADFGLLATTPVAKTGVLRAMGDAGDETASASELLSWPLMVHLQNQVQIVYTRLANGTAATPAVAPTPDAAAGHPALQQLRFHAPASRALLTGDRRAGRTLFWSAAATAAETTDPPARARLVAEFSDGLQMEIAADRLVVELAWNSAHGETELRWGGLGAVEIQLRHAAKADAPPPPAWWLTADACALISLPGIATPPAAEHHGPPGNLPTELPSDLPAELPSNFPADFPVALPRAVTATLLLSVGGRATLRQISAPPFATEPDRLTARFNRGLFELGGEVTGPRGTAVAGETAAPGPATGILRRAWLTQTGLVAPPADGNFAADFYQPWTATDLRAVLTAATPTVPVAADRIVISATGLNFSETPATPPAVAQTAGLSAERLYLESRGSAFRVVAASSAPERSVAADGTHRLAAPQLELTPDSLTISGAERWMEQMETGTRGEQR